MSAANFDDLIAHVGHDIVCVTYGQHPGEAELTPELSNNKFVVNVAIECNDCGCVIVDYDKESHNEI